MEALTETSGGSPAPAPDALELLNLSALDGEFYCRQWFPRAFRNASAPMHAEAWHALEGGWRYVDIEFFRGAAKTTLLRAFASKRIAFAESRTILYVSESQDHAKRSVRWLKRQVLYNTEWANFFQLSLGTKKTDEWLEIVHGIDQVPISVLAVGITGQTRGVNLDDFRPDLIIVDDPCDEENTATAEQRKKISDLFFGALAKSLAPPADSDNALMCLLQTPLNGEDLISQCRKDPQWKSLTFGCFTDDEQSRWPARYPTEFLLAEKKAHMARNQAALWYREMECKIVSEATSAFRAKWLKEWPADKHPRDMLDEGGQAFLWIDPVPPPSARQLAIGLRDKDYEALAVVVKWKGAIYLAETVANRGHEPSWTVMKFWELVQRWRVFQFGVEEIAYQATLKWLLEQSMKEKGVYISCYVQDKQDRRKKTYRIIDSLTGITSQGQFYVNFELHSDFVEQFTAYPDVAHDDVIEAVAEATRIARESLIIEGMSHRLDDDGYNEDKPQLGFAP